MTDIHFFRNIIIALLFILFPLQISAQNYWKRDYTKADEIAKKTQKTTDLKKLSLKLTRSLPDTVDKYRAIFSWIAFNISYDVKGLEDINNVKTDATDVLSKGSSVCEGYTNLFQALCEASGLPCVSIAGWTKNFPEKIGKPFTKYTTHAWNVIRLDNTWYLCDVTWAAGSLYDGKYKQEFSGYYFCMPKDLFALNHYPEDKKWMLGTKMSEQSFINAPFYFGPSLAANIANLEPSSGTIKYRKGETIKFSFHADEPINNILVRPVNAPTSKEVTFKQAKNKISFSYNLDQYAQFLYIYVNNKGFLVYRIER